ncbi:MAG: penicillin-insensitive murein endopeptidase [Deltaproteobacteria bacterium]|nr:penicillin-insensitive murein endopeptidase [Deltaproteobacteria bacterium]
MRRVLACLIVALVLPVSSPAMGQTWVVRRGENLTRIARRFDVAIDDLRRWNELRNDRLHPGQRLVVNATQAPKAPDRPGKTATRSRRPKVPKPNVTVRPGDSLNKIAKRHEVKVSDLRLWNQDLAGDHIRPGQRLRVGSFYAIRKNDTMGAIARRHDVTVDELLGWNPGIDRNWIRPGQQVVVFDRPRARPKPIAEAPAATPRKVSSKEPAKKSSAGEASSGVRSTKSAKKKANKAQGKVSSAKPVAKDSCKNRRKVSSTKAAQTKPSKPERKRLRYGVPVRKNAGYAIRSRKRSYGTQTTVDALRGAFDSVVKRAPKGARVWVLDVSLPQGGPMTGHRSHETGRDVDLTYYQKHCGRRACMLRKVTARSLDAQRQWALLSYWLRRGDAQYIFIDYALQVPLYAAARKAGATRKQLEQWFQYPRKQKIRKGIIRHAANHADHMHLRFRCPRRDRSCR